MSSISKKSGGVPINASPSSVGLTNSRYYYEIDLKSIPDPSDNIANLDIRVSWPATLALTNRTTYFYSTVISRH